MSPSLVVRPLPDTGSGTFGVFGGLVLAALAVGLAAAVVPDPSTHVWWVFVVFGVWLVGSGVLIPLSRRLAALRFEPDQLVVVGKTGLRTRVGWPDVVAVTVREFEYDDGSVRSRWLQLVVSRDADVPSPPTPAESPWHRRSRRDVPLVRIPDPLAEPRGRRGRMRYRTYQVVRRELEARGFTVPD